MRPRIYDGEHAEEQDTLPWEEAALRFHVWQDALRDTTHPLWIEAEETHSAGVARCRGHLCVVGQDAERRTHRSRSPSGSHRMCPSWLVVTIPPCGPRRFLANPDIDAVVTGEGEATFVEFLEGLERSGLDEMEVPAGCFVRRPDGAIDRGAQRPLIDDLDTVAFPNLDALLNLDTYRPVDLGAVIGMRGCPFRLLVLRRFDDMDEPCAFSFAKQRR